MGYSETHIARELEKLGHKVAFLTSNYYFPFPNYAETVGKVLGDRKLKPGVYRENGNAVYRQKLIFELFSRSYFGNHEQVVRKFKPDVVITNKASGLNTWKITGLKDKYQFKLVCYDSHLPSELLREKVWLKKLFYFLFRVFFSKKINSKVDKFVAVQEDTEGLMKKYCGIRKPIQFIPLGTDLNRFYPDKGGGRIIRKKYGIKDRDFVVIYTGKIIPAKGVDILFSAFNLLQKRYQYAKLLIVGDGTEEYKNTCLNKVDPKYKENIIWAGFKQNKDLYQYYSASDVAVWPLQESTSMNDAAACAIPFIANNELGTELRISNANALLYKKGNYHDLALKIEKLIKDGNLARKMGQNGRRLAEEKLSWSKIAPEYLNFDGIKKSVKYRNLLKLASVSFILKDFFRIKNPAYGNKVHIKAAIAWLKRAQDIVGDGGMSKWYSLFDGWQPSYIETTGYILETFVDYYKYSKEEDIKKRAIRMADFLLAMQLPSGGFRSQTPQEFSCSSPVVFDTAQNILGLVSIYNLTGRRKYLTSAVSAADFLCSIQEKDGGWVRDNFGPEAHTYDTRVAWALLEVWKATGGGKYKDSAKIFLEWAAKRQQRNFWFEKTNFPPPHFSQPFTHNIGYVLEGFLYSSILLQNKRYLDIVKNTADVLLRYFQKHNFMPGYFDKHWCCPAKFTCLTGNAQISIIWLKLYSLTKEKKYFEVAKRMNLFLKTTQIISGASDDVKGAIKGSYPIYGDILRKEGYSRMAYLNWATKFFVDALLEEELLKEKT